MASSDVDRVHKEFSELIEMLEGTGEISLLNTIDENFRKLLLMAAASYFERQMSNALLEFAADVTTKDHVLMRLVEAKAVRRQYHTWFDWNGNNANQFFGLFGTSFQQSMREKVRGNKDLENSIGAFIEIGRDRNRLVHENFASFSLEKTSKEIYGLYRSALKFVDWFPVEIRRFCRNQSIPVNG